MKIVLVVAMAENRVIGVNNKLPWYLPQDLKFFKAVTMGKPIIMGRKTHESIGKPLPGRTNIVISRDPAYSATGCKTATSLDQAISIAEAVAAIDGVEEIAIVGGEQIYHQALPLTDRIYLTQVHAEVTGDAFFPVFDPAAWQETQRQNFSAEGLNPYDYSFLVLDRHQ